MDHALRMRCHQPFSKLDTQTKDFFLGQRSNLHLAAQRCAVDQLHCEKIHAILCAGFDVFAMDLTGYGLSPRPMMDDPCNNSTSDQQSYLTSKPLAQPCSPSYPFQLTSLES